MTEECLAFNVYVRRRRLELGLTQRAVSRKLGLKHAGTISRIESGERKLPLNLLPDFADALRLDRTELCRIFLKKTALKFNQALFAQRDESHRTSGLPVERPEPCTPVFTAMMFAQTRESILGKITWRLATNPR